MKKTVFLLILFAFSNLNAQDVIRKSIPENSNEDFENQETESIKISEVGRYKLYPTQNIFNFLKLDTRTGVIIRIQWNVSADKRFTNVVSPDHLINYTYDEIVNGRFEISLTENLYNFLLLDKIDGRVWQCQWNFDADKNWIERLY